MAFFTKIPPKFECRKEGSDDWHECTKSEICNEGISKDNYRPVESEDEYIDNWIEQYDLLCEPKWKIGLIGSTYFFGLICTIIILPCIADKKGRKLVNIISHIVFIIAAIALVFASDITTLFILIFICGATFGGKIIVGINHLLEF